MIGTLTEFQKRFCVKCEWCDKSTLFCLRYGAVVGDNVTECEISERVNALRAVEWYLEGDKR